MWQPSREQWRIIWAAAVVMILAFGHPTEWRWVLSSPQGVFDAMSVAQVKEEIDRHAGSAVPDVQIVLDAAASRIADAQRRFGLCVVAFAVLIVWRLNQGKVLSKG